MRLILHKLLLAFMHLWFCFSSSTHVDAADDSLKPGDTFNTSSELYSKSRKYLLYFNSVTSGGEILTYLTIQSEYEAAIVWEGNKEQSVDYNDAVLSLNFSGVLKIESSSVNKPIILYSPPQPINNTVATLLDTGNFVLQHLHSNGTNTLLWQSFDYPFATLIPTMKLGVNHKTGHRSLLSSQKNEDGPTPGGFSLEWEPRGQELMIRRRGKVCWKSGKLRNNRFEHIPEDAQAVLKYSIVSNLDEDTFSFTSTNENITHIWSLSDTGRLYYNDKQGYVARADLCYGYNNTEGGCQRWQDIPKCRIPGDVFTKKSIHSNDENVTYETKENINHSDCEAACWGDCNCNGFAELYTDGTGCRFFQWNSSKDYIVDATVSGQDIYLLENKGNIIDHPHGTKRWIWISTVIATTLLILCASILCLAVKKRKHVLQATNEFSSENKLGQGGFGPVYKGTLPTGEEVAIKRLARSSAQGIVEFKNELTLICELQHMNLVQLLGCCIHDEEKILIYEYMPNKSLDFHLFDSTRSKLLHWNKRFNIIKWISQGLLYLHKYSRLKVWELWKDDKYFELMDPSLNEVFDHEEVQRCIHIGLLCVEHYANDRPTMSDIILMLTSKSSIVSLPQKPAFYVQRYMYDENLSSLELYTGSTVGITSSTVEMTAST
ncbi:hypothetical protein PHAVU_011G176300 [Phaseolus vulgaris]